jgi:hypothetical protein
MKRNNYRKIITETIFNKAENNTKGKDLESIEVRYTYKTKLPLYSMVAQKFVLPNGEKKRALSIMLEFDSYERYCFNIIQRNIHYDKFEGVWILTADISHEEYNSSRFSRGYKSLREKDIVKKTKKKQYIINPSFLIPGTQYEQAVKMWNSIE